MMKLLAVWLVLLFGAANFAFPAAALLQSFVVIGNIRDHTGQPVANIRVSLLDENYQALRTVFADNSGRFQFRGLGSGRFFVRVEPTGTLYEERTESLDLQSVSPRPVVEPIILDFVLKPKKDEGAPPRSETLFFQDIPKKARAEYERGLQHLRKNKSEPAIAALKKGIEIFPDYFLALELLGTEYVKRGEFAAALPLLSHALQVNPSAPRSLYALGVAHLKLNRSDEAIAWLQKAAPLDPSNFNVHMMLGIAYGNQRTLDQSEASFKKALELGGTPAADARLYLAGIYNNQKKYSDAVQQLELYLKEAKDVKDTDKIKRMIAGLRAKEGGKN